MRWAKNFTSLKYFSFIKKSSYKKKFVIKGRCSKESAKLECMFRMLEEKDMKLSTASLCSFNVGTPTCTSFLLNTVTLLRGHA